MTVTTLPIASTTLPWASNWEYSVIDDSRLGRFNWS